MKTFQLQDIFTDEQIQEALDMFKVTPTGFAKKFAKEYVEPRIDEINKKLGQENDPVYIAYCMELSLVQAINAICSN
jgi:hypothetical protein